MQVSRVYPKVNVFSIQHNEEFMLPHFLKHYSQYADRIFIIDDHSTDLTAMIARAHPMVTYLEYPFEGLNEQEFSDTLESMYKTYPSDWAVCVDGDEFVDISYLDKLKKGKVYKTRSFMMIGKTGKFKDCKAVRWEKFDKPIVFDSKLDVKFGDGRHTCNLPTEPGPNLLHYKYPSREYYLKRARETYPRIMNEKQMAYRIDRGLEWYDKHI